MRRDLDSPRASPQPISLAAGAHSADRRSCPSWNVTEAPTASRPCSRRLRRRMRAGGHRREPLSTAHRWDPFDMQSDATRRSEAGERRDSGAWRRETANVSCAEKRSRIPRPPASEASTGRREPAGLQPQEPRDPPQRLSACTPPQSRRPKPSARKRCAGTLSPPSWENLRTSLEATSRGWPRLVVCRGSEAPELDAVRSLL